MCRAKNGSKWLKNMTFLLHTSLHTSNREVCKVCSSNEKPGTRPGSVGSCNLIYFQKL